MDLWSRQMADHYALQLPSDLVAWLDDGLSNQLGGSEFSVPLTPERLLDPEPGLIWGGFMPPDMLPLVGNNYGDWLAARVGFDNKVIEVVYWCHAGGDWLRYGNSLAEALLFDALHRCRHGRSVHQVHEESPIADVFRLAEWARDRLTVERNLDLPVFWQKPDGGAFGETLDHFELAGICRVAVARERVLAALQHPLRTCANSALAAKLAWSWNPQMVQRQFDAKLIPPDERSAVVTAMDIDTSLDEQGWEEAEEIALRVTVESPDTGWAWDIVGWSAERRGDREIAIDRYRKGQFCSVFSVDSVSFYTHWFLEAAGKFSTARLLELNATLEGDEAQYLSLMSGDDDRAMRESVHRYWLKRAREAQADGNAEEAYRYHYRSGWDVGLVNRQRYRSILDELVQAATTSGSEALARIAGLHRRSL